MRPPPGGRFLCDHRCDGRHRVQQPGCPERLREGPPAGCAGTARRSPAGPGGRRDHAAALRGGRRGAWSHGREADRPAVDTAPADRRLRRPRRGVRQPVPADDRSGSAALAAHQRGPAAWQGHASDRGPAGRRPLLRLGRSPPGLRGPSPGPRRDRGLRDRGPDPGQAGRGPGDRRAPGQGPRTAVHRARAAAARSPPADQLQPARGGLREARRERRGLGLPADPGTRRAARSARGRRGLVRGRVRAGGRGARRGGAARRLHRR